MHRCTHKQTNGVIDNRAKLLVINKTLNKHCTVSVERLFLKCATVYTDHSMREEISMLRILADIPTSVNFSMVFSLLEATQSWVST